MNSYPKSCSGVSFYRGDQAQMDHIKAAGIWGMAARAGKVVAGDMACEKALEEGRVKCMYVNGASDNTKRKFVYLCQKHGANVITTSGTEDIGKWVGKPGRKVIAIMDGNFAQAIVKAMGSETSNLGV